MAKARRGFGFLVCRSRRSEQGAAKVVEIVRDRIHAALASIRSATSRFFAQCSAVPSAPARSMPICKKPSIPILPRRSRNSGRFRARRQDHADRERLRSRCLQWRSWNRVAHRRGRRPPRRRLRRSRGRISFGELDTLVPAYATTIHKSQGSEYPAVVITLATQHYTMLARNLVYTAVTRGKRLVVIVGQRRAMAIAVRSGGGRKRWTNFGNGCRFRFQCEIELS